MKHLRIVLTIAVVLSAVLAPAHAREAGTKKAQVKMDLFDVKHFIDPVTINACDRKALDKARAVMKHRSVRRNWPDGDGDVPVITDLEALLDLDDLMGHP